MRITFNTYHPVQFRGLNDAMNRIKSQINNGSIPTRDGFKPVQDGGTVIIENYYEGGQDKTDFSKLGNGRGSAAAEGAVSGATTGTAIEGTKTVVKKVKGSDNIEKPNENALDADDSTSIDLLGEDKNVEISEKTTAKEPEMKNDKELIDDNSNDLADVDEEIDTTDSDIDVDIETDIDVDPEIDVDIDAFDTI